MDSTRRFLVLKLPRYRIAKHGCLQGIRPPPWAHHFDKIRNMETSLVERLATAFAALGNPTRIRIFRLLLAASHSGGMTAGKIQAELGIPASTLTHHLAKLEYAGLIGSRQQRQWIWYSIDPQVLREMLAFLFEECCTRAGVIPIEQFTGRGEYENTLGNQERG